MTNYMPVVHDARRILKLHRDGHGVVPHVLESTLNKVERAYLSCRNIRVLQHLHVALDDLSTIAL